MKELHQYTQFLEQKVNTFSFPNEPKNLYDPLRYFLTIGGKRMRPILTLMSANLFDVSKEEAYSAAMSIELFHNFSLIHDDIMDMAPVRRGKETVHEKWNSTIAILSGDVLLVKAYEQLSHYTDDRLSELFTLFNTTAKEVCEGQQLDMDFEQQNTVEISEYIEMIRLKTSVLLGCALEFGAILGRQDEAVKKALYNYGVELGIAFQIQDDLLDLYGNPETFGKQIGGDVLSHKKTLLWLEAEKLDSTVIEKVKSESDPVKKVELARELFSQCGAKAKTEEEKTFHYNKAIQSLNSLNLSKEKSDPLFQLANFLLNRAN
ncbi:MAG: polyprenyl synthetase family protein [Fluviicola sp.]